MLVYLLLRIFNQRVAPIYTRRARPRGRRLDAASGEPLRRGRHQDLRPREGRKPSASGRPTEAYYDQQVKAINARSLCFPVQPGGRVPEQRLHDRRGRILDAQRAEAFTLGKLLAFRAYWWRLFGPIQTLARVNDMVQRAVAAGRRVFEVLDAPDELPDAPDAIDVSRRSSARWNCAM